MKFYRLATASFLIAMGFDTVALPQEVRTRNSIAPLLKECTHSTARPVDKYSKGRVDFALILKTAKRLPVENHLKPGCSRHEANVPGRELKFFIQPRTLARIRRA